MGFSENDGCRSLFEKITKKYLKTCYNKFAGHVCAFGTYIPEALGSYSEANTFLAKSRKFRIDLHLTLPLREKTPSITQKPQNHCYFCNFDLKVVQIHPFWLIFCLQALFDLPDSILIVSRPKKAKKDQKRPKTQNYI